MERPIVACIQHRLITPKSADEYDAHLNRFLRTARAKGAELALFPELSGVATAIPTFGGWRNDLLRRAGQGQRPRAGLWQRTKSRLAGGAAAIVRADLHKSLLQALAEMPESLHDAYAALFSGLAQRYEMTIVAGSLYDYNPAREVIENVSLVFGPDGALLGRQAKTMLSLSDQEVSQSAEGWAIIPTPAGRVGILLGNDVLYPEPARVLAYQGADMLLTMAAVVNPANYHKIRQAAAARCQENQLYGMVSFLVGPDPFAPADAPPFVGKSAIFAPLEFTPRFSGVMIEVGSPLAEGVITAELDYPALEALWQESETPLRREMPLLQTGPALAALYGRALPLAEAAPLMLAEAAPTPGPAAEPEPSYTQIAPILPDVSFGHTPAEFAPPAIGPDERQAAQEALAGRMEVHAQNVDAAAAEVRSAIHQASEQVRAAAGESPEQVEEEIAQVVAAARLELDDAVPAPAAEPTPTPTPALDLEPIPAPRKPRWPWQRSR